MGTKVDQFDHPVETPIPSNFSSYYEVNGRKNMATDGNNLNEDFHRIATMNHFGPNYHNSGAKPWVHLHIIPCQHDV